MTHLTPSEIIIKVISYSGLTYPKFAKVIGRDSPQFLRDIVKGQTQIISKKVATEICAAFPEIDYDFLITGKGNMLKTDQQNLEQVDHDNYMKVEYRDLSVAAGALTKTISNRRTILVPKEYDKGDYLVVRVAGPSMDDGTKYSIPESAEILIKKINLESGQSLPIRGNLFVIDFKDGQDLKQIIEHNVEEGYIVCHSYNPEFRDYKVMVEDIIGIFLFRKIVSYRPPVRDIIIK